MSQNYPKNTQTGDADSSPSNIPTGGAIATIDAAQIFAGQKELRLVHNGQEYRLRITRQGKLILTK